MCQNSKFIKIENIAKECGYRFVFKVENEEKMKKIVKKSIKLVGPIMILIKIKNDGEIGGRMKISPIELKKRFMKNLE